ncbi:MAG: hypothetical protein MJZ58_03770, partial [Paludibacteraceae bacterium]|nr:hypothetical protein [Paludibacteraceae bacterium]
MNKILTTFLSICLSLSLSATDISSKAVYKALPFTPSASQPVSLSASQPLTPAIQKAIAHGPSATKGETKNVTFKWYAKSYNDYQQAWQLVLETPGCRFDILFKKGTTTIEYGKVYTMDDLNKTYTSVQEGGAYRSLASMQLIITLDEDKKEHIELIAVDTKKDPTTYHGVYNPKPLPACIDTIDVVLETTDFQDE